MELGDKSLSRDLRPICNELTASNACLGQVRRLGDPGFGVSFATPRFRRGNCNELSSSCSLCPPFWVPSSTSAFAVESVLPVHLHRLPVRIRLLHRNRWLRYRDRSDRSNAWRPSARRFLRTRYCRCWRAMSFVQGYDNGRPTEFLLLVDRYLQQARELQALTDSTGTIRMPDCDHAGHLLQNLGYRLQSGCGQKEVLLDNLELRKSIFDYRLRFPTHRIGTRSPQECPRSPITSPRHECRY